MTKSYKQLYDEHNKETLIEYENFNNNFNNNLNSYNENTDVFIKFTKKGLKKFMEDFYNPLMKKLKSFSNIFILIDFIEDCFGVSNIGSTHDLKENIEKLYNENPKIKAYDVMNKFFPNIIDDTDEDIFMKINAYALDDTYIEFIDDVVNLSITSKNVEEIISKIQNSNKKFYL
jgi:hypothetical protein